MTDHADLQAHAYITTYTGARFSYAEPGPFRIRDIAHSLSLLPRFLGHTRGFYSVAQHSLYVCDILHEEGADRHLQAAGLLHDAQEAYIGDIPSPLKWACPEIATLEQLIAIRLRAQFIPLCCEDDWRIVKEIDNIALHTEAWSLFNPIPAWVRPPKGPATKIGLPPQAAEGFFLDRAAELGLV